MMNPWKNAFGSGERAGDAVTRMGDLMFEARFPSEYYTDFIGIEMFGLLLS